MTRIDARDCPWYSLDLQNLFDFGLLASLEFPTTPGVGDCAVPRFFAVTVDIPQVAIHTKSCWRRAAAFEASSKALRYANA